MQYLQENHKTPQSLRDIIYDPCTDHKECGRGPVVAIGYGERCSLVAKLSLLNA